jgi:hypothetical protein
VSREVRFTVPLPLDVEPLLEELLGAKVLAKEFRARTQAAGDFLAGLVREAHTVRFAHARKFRRSQKPPEPEED